MEEAVEVEEEVEDAWDVRSATPGRRNCTRSTVDSCEGGSEGVSPLPLPTSATADGDVSLITPLGPCMLALLVRLSLVEAAGKGVTDSLRNGVCVSAGGSEGGISFGRSVKGAEGMDSRRGATSESLRSPLSWSVS